MNRKGKGILILALAAAFLGMSIHSLAEEIESRKLSIMEVDGGNGFIIKGAGSKLKAVKGMGLAQGNRVETGDITSIYIEADQDKTVRLDENTKVEISKASAKSLKMTLKTGSLFFNVEKPLKADEEMTFDAANTSMSIRGTSGIFTMDPEKLVFYLIEGSVAWDLGDGTTLYIDAGDVVELDRFRKDGITGPSADVIYKLNQVFPFEWTDLDDAGLVAVMENRDKLDLEIIGLDTPEEIVEAMHRVEEILEEKQEVIISYSGDDDDDSDYDDNDNDDNDDNADAEETTIDDDIIDEDEWLTEEESSEETESSIEETEESSEESEPSIEETEESSEETESSSEEAESTTEETKATNPGVNGDYLYDADGEAVWVDYEEDTNGYWSETTWIWNQTWLEENSYTETLVEAP